MLPEEIENASQSTPSRSRRAPQWYGKRTASEIAHESDDFNDSLDGDLDYIPQESRHHEKKKNHQSREC